MQVTQRCSQELADPRIRDVDVTALQEGLTPWLLHVCPQSRPRTLRQQDCLRPQGSSSLMQLGVITPGKC